MFHPLHSESDIHYGGLRSHPVTGRGLQRGNTIGPATPGSKPHPPIRHAGTAIGLKVSRCIKYTFSETRSVGK